MTPRTFWTIFIKILGIWLVTDFLYIVPQSITPFFYMGSNDVVAEMVAAGLLLLVVIGYLLLLLFTVFKTGWVIDKLHLDKGFTEDKFELNIHRSTVLAIAVIVIGGITFIDGFPLLCRSIYRYIAAKNSLTTEEQRVQEVSWLIFYFIKTALGIFFMTSNRLVVSLIERQRKQVRNVEMESEE